MKKTLVLICFAILCVTGTARADIAMPNMIAGWNMSGVSGQPVSAPGTGSSDVTAYNMTRGAGLTIPSATNNAFNSSGWTASSNNYVQFGFNVASGYSANLSDLYFGTKASATGPTQLLVKTSLDNYAATIATINEDNAGGTYSNPDVSLSRLGAVTGDFYIRLYGSGATSSNGTARVSAYDPSGTYYYDSITGTVGQNVASTPIPAGVWLLGSGLAGLVGIKKKLVK